VRLGQPRGNQTPQPHAAAACDHAELAGVERRASFRPEPLRDGPPEHPLSAWESLQLARREAVPKRGSGDHHPAQASARHQRGGLQGDEATHAVPEEVKLPVRNLLTIAA
jgi:hypothetical protein